MECSWERVITIAATFRNAKAAVDYLATLERLLQDPVNNFPHRPVPFLPPQPTMEQSNLPQPQVRANRPPNFFNLLSDDSSDEGQHQQEAHLNRGRGGGRGERGRADRGRGRSGGGRGGGRGQGILVPAVVGRSFWSAEDIYIQVITALGELLGKMALEHARLKEWRSGADLFGEACRLLNMALALADGVYVNVVTGVENGGYEPAEVIERVRNKCYAISIAATHCSENEVKFE